MSSGNEKPKTLIGKELTEQLKCESEAGIMSCIERLKKDSKCYDEFIQDGGLGILISMLRYQNLRVLNNVLSILADACIKSNTRDEVRDTKICTHAIWILKNLKHGRTLHCRVYRLIGNLSESDWYAKTFYENGIIQVLANTLETESNIQTHLMAVRVVRIIWTIHESSRDVILNLQIIGSISNLFIISKQKVDEGEKKYSDLVDVCLKAMSCFFSTMNFHSDSQITELCYKYLLEYCNTDNKMAIKCIYYLCHFARSRPVLGSSGAIESLIGIVNRQPTVCKEVLISLCFLCFEAVNRARFRYGEGLKVMLNLLRNNDTEKYHPSLLHALVQFVYDDPSIQIMVENGLLNILTTKLKNMVTELPNDETDKMNTNKRRNESSPACNTEAKQNKISNTRYSLDHYHENWSPGSTTSMSSSPPSTPPYFDELLSLDDMSEDNYSPVCSDTEWADNQEELQEEAESVKSYKSVTFGTNNVRDSVNFIGDNAKKYVNTWTLTLLNKLSHSDSLIKNLADPTFIKTLSAYIKCAKNPEACRILTRIVKNRAYLMPLLIQGFVFEAQTLYGSESYIQPLCSLAETGGAIGDLSAVLLRGSESHKAIVAVSIPFIIKSTKQLKSLLQNHGGLSVIFSILENQNHDLNENAIWSICQLANSLKIEPDLLDKNHFDNVPVVTNSNCAYDNLSKPSTVTFELDDGTTVNTCRRTLCQRSTVFSAMLEGNFSESGKRKVKLQNTSKKGLDTLLLAARGEPFECCAIESLLDAVLLADKFLMSELYETLTESSISMMNYRNFSRAWNWARTNCCDDLRSYCVKKFLTTTMTKHQRNQAFCDFTRASCFSEFLDEIKEIINSVLSQR